MVHTRTEQLGVSPLNRHFRFQNGDMGLEAGEAALYVPELLESDISGKARFGHMVIPQFEAHAVGDDRALTHGDVGERSGMHEAGLILGRAHQGRVDGVAHEGRHGVAHFQVAGGDRFAALVEGHGDVVEPLLQVRQIADHRQDRHTF
jgi:hypothetical protein